MAADPPLGNCKGRNMLVTGGASGLGESIVTRYAQAGARVVIADKDEQLGRALEKRLVAAGHEVKYVFVDVVTVASQAAMLREALAWFPDNEAIDALVLCAGIVGNPFDTTPEDPSALNDTDALSLLERNAATVQVNLVSTLQLVQLAAKYAMGLKARQEETGGNQVKLGSKSITLIASLAAYRSLPRAVGYTASKWGLRGAFRSLRQLLPGMGVRVNIVAPAFVRTPLLTETIPMYEKMGVKFASREDVAAAVCHVVEDEQCNGRSYAVSSEGFVDLDDDVAGRDAFDVIGGLVGRGALGSADCPIGHDGTR